MSRLIFVLSDDVPIWSSLTITRIATFVELLQRLNTMEKYSFFAFTVLLTVLLNGCGGGAGDSGGNTSPSISSVVAISSSSASSTSSRGSDSPASLASSARNEEASSNNASSDGAIIPAGSSSSSHSGSTMSKSSGSLQSSSAISESTSSLQSSSAAALVTLLVEAEDYQNYSDSTPGNQGGFYRNDSVDIESTSDAGGGYNVGWTVADEWLTYSITLAPGTYNVTARVASVDSGTYSLSVDGASVGKPKSVTTSGWQSWATQRIGQLVVTDNSVRNLRLMIDAGKVNVNWIKFTLDTGSSSVSSARANSTHLAYSKINPAQIFSFDHSNLWGVSAGSGQLSKNRTQGEYALSIKNFTSTVITSPSINSFKGLGSELSIDVFFDANYQGTLALEVSIPSKNIFNLRLKTFKIDDIPANVFTTLTASIPPSISSLADEYHDLSFRFLVMSGATINELTLDKMTFSAKVDQVQDKVEIEVNGNTDILYFIVNDVAREVWRSGKLNGNKARTIVNGKLDVTSLFWQGTNAVRIVGINGRNRNPIDVKLWVNNQLVFEQYCEEYEDSNHCLPANPEGIRHRYNLTLNTPNLPAAKKVQVAPQLDSGWAANLYINDMFITGTMPATVYLPEGKHKVGLGKFRDQHQNYDAKFYESEVNLINGNMLLDFTGEHPLGIQNTIKIAVVPIKYAQYSDTNLIGVLKESEIDGYRKQLAMTYENWAKHFSYGMQKWDVTVLPMVENKTLQTNSGQHFSPQNYLAEAGLQHIQQEYQIIIFAFSVYNTNGVRIDGSGGAGAWASDGFISVNNATDWPATPNAAHPVFIHEILHVYEQYQRDVYGYYNGVLGHHGAPKQGYSETSPLGELYWMGWYKDFMRNIVAENHTVRPDVEPGKIPDEYDVHIGTFETTRYGLGFLH
jgi:hypothetical protein